MIKTVKVKKQMRLDELIKHIFDNDITGKRFEERLDYESYSITHAVHVTGNRVMNVEGLFNPDTKFTVEVEEEITEDTTFERLVTLGCRGTINVHDDKSLSDLSGKKEYGAQVFALINGKLQLIWETE